MHGMSDSAVVLERTKFLVECALILQVPIIATEQYPTRMGGTEESLLALLPCPPLPKMAFSCCGAEGFSEALGDRNQIVLVGIESHICVAQTALDLRASGKAVVLAEDAITTRSADRHRLGIARAAAAGATVAHTEAIVYEWMVSADHPSFRNVLNVVKRTA